MPAWFKAIDLAFPAPMSPVEEEDFGSSKMLFGGDGGVIAQQVCQLFGRKVNDIVVGQRVEGVAVVIL